MITNNFNKELRGISDALCDLGYTDSTIGLRQRYWKEYCCYHGSLDIDEASMDEFTVFRVGTSTFPNDSMKHELRFVICWNIAVMEKSRTIIRRGLKICRGWSLFEL